MLDISLRGQTVHSLECKWIPQQAKIKFVAKSAILLLFVNHLAVLDSANNYLKHSTAQSRFKNRRNCGIRNCIGGTQNNLWNPQTNKKTCV